MALGRVVDCVDEVDVVDGTGWAVGAETEEAELERGISECS